MKNWRKVILGVALSFMILFIGLGFAELTDTLSIVGSLTATEPNTLYITNISPVGTAPAATITGYTSLRATITETVTYAITVKNNTDKNYTYVYTGANVTTGNASVTAEYRSVAKEETGTEDPYKIPENKTFAFPQNTTEGAVYVSGIPIDPSENSSDTFTFYVQLTPTNSTSPTEVEFLFSEQVKYSIYYINNGEALDIRCVLNNEAAVSTENGTAVSKAVEQMNDPNDDDNTVYSFSHWMNAGSTQIDEVEKDNAEDVMLYPAFVGVYTAIFLDQDGEIIDWCTFSTSNTNNVTTMATKLVSDGMVTETDELSFDYWEVHVTDADGNTTKKEKLSTYTFEATDIAIYPVYTYNGDVNLIPVDNDGNGTIDEYQVGGYSDPNGQELVVIPESVNGIDTVAINANAFAGYEGVHAVTIPGSVKEINAQAFTDSDYFDSTILGSSGREMVTLYFSGNPQNVNDGLNDYVNGTTTDNPDKVVFQEKWDNGMGEGSRIFFLGEDGKVDANAGYWELKRKVEGSGFNRKVVYYWEYVSTVEGIDYSETECDCDDVDHADTNGLRPDYIYWPATTASEETP